MVKAYSWLLLIFASSTSSGAAVPMKRQPQQALDLPPKGFKGHPDSQVHYPETRPKGQFARRIRICHHIVQNSHRSVAGWTDRCTDRRKAFARLLNGLTLSHSNSGLLGHTRDTAHHCQLRWVVATACFQDTKTVCGKDFNQTQH